MAVFHRVLGGVNQVQDTNTYARAEGFHGCGDQVNGFIGVPNVGQIHHCWEGFGIVNVRHSAAVFVSCRAAVRLAVVIQVKEIHPQTDFGCSPAAHDGVAESCSACNRMGKVSFGRIGWVRNIRHITNSKAGFPVTSVDKRATKSRIVRVLAWPSLNGHIVNVNPPTHRGLPSHFVFTHFDDGVAKTRGGDIGEVPSC